MNRSRHDVVRVAAGHDVAGKSRHDDEKIQPRLGQRDKVRGREACAPERQKPSTSYVLRPLAGGRGRAYPIRDDAVLPWTAVRAGAAANKLRKLRSVSTSDVASTSAPLTTCAVLMSGWSPDQIDERAERDLRETKQHEQRRGPDQLAASAVMIPDVTGRRQDGERHEQCADPMREVHGNAGVPDRRQQRDQTRRESPGSPARRRYAASWRRAGSGSRS